MGVPVFIAIVFALAVAGEFVTTRAHAKRMGAREVTFLLEAYREIDAMGLNGPRMAPPAPAEHDFRFDPNLAEFDHAAKWTATQNMELANAPPLTAEQQMLLANVHPFRVLDSEEQRVLEIAAVATADIADPRKRERVYERLSWEALCALSNSRGNS